MKRTRSHTACTTGAPKASALLQLGALLGLVLAPAIALCQTSGTHAIDAGGWVDSEGKIRPGAVVVIAGGLISQVGGEVPAGTPVDRYPTALVCPGLIDCQTTLGVVGALSEREKAIQPRVNARDAFNRFSSQLRAALEAGVTTFALAPNDENVVGGQIAICQTAGPDGRPRVLVDTGPLKLSLSPDVLKTDREPTSRGGAIGLLRDTLDAAGSTGNKIEDDPLAAFVSGRLPGIMTAPSGADVLSALELADAHHLKLALVHTHDARLVAEHVAGHATGVIVGPLSLTTGRRDALAAEMFASRGVEVAIAGGLPDGPADSLRIGAAVATRAGLSPEAARRAISVWESPPAIVSSVMTYRARFISGIRPSGSGHCGQGPAGSGSRARRTMPS